MRVPLPDRRWRSFLWVDRYRPTLATDPRAERAVFDAPLFGLAPDGVYHAVPVTGRRGALLPLPFTLTSESVNSSGWRFAFCGTFPEVALAGCYPASCSVEPGLSSRSHKRTSDRPTHSGVNILLHNQERVAPSAPRVKKKTHKGEVKQSIAVSS